MNYKDVKTNDIFYANWHNRLMYILDADIEEYEFLMFDENKNEIRIDTGPEVQWETSMWNGREPVQEHLRPRYEKRFIIEEIFYARLDI